MLAYLFWGILFVLIFLVFSDERYRRKLLYYFNTYVLILVVLFFVISVVIFPEESVEAAYQGLVTWFTVVLPSLLPFFIGAELLIGLGLVKFIGLLLEPLMRPLFNVPGEGSFAFTMSITSGYPVGAKIVSRLRSEGQVTAVEGQRLLSFCSTSGPLFLVGAVGVGMFHSAEVGFFLAMIHYLSAIIVGILFRFYKWDRSPAFKKSVPTQSHLLRNALRELGRTRRSNPSFGILLGNAVKESFNTMLMVGGFIILFSVIVNVLGLLGINQLLSTLLMPFQVNPYLMKGIFVGFFEITNGSQLVAEIPSVSLLTRIAATSFLIAWSGFSIIAQATSIIATTDLKTGVYLFSKLCHGVVSITLAYLLYPLLQPFIDFSSAVTGSFQQAKYISDITSNLKLSVELFILVILSLFIASLLLSGILLALEALKGRRKTFR